MTTTKTQTYQRVLNQANLNQIADALRAMKIGWQLSPVKVIFSGLSSSATQDITTAAAKVAATTAGGSITGLDLDDGENLPPIGIVRTLRPTTGSAGALGRYVGDAGITPTTTVASLSDDGSTLVFEAAVTGFVLEYYPAPAVTMTDEFVTDV